MLENLEIAFYLLTAHLLPYSRFFFRLICHCEYVLVRMLRITYEIDKENRVFACYKGVLTRSRQSVPN